MTRYMGWALLAAAVPALLYVGLAMIKGRKGALETVFGPVKREPVDFPSLELKTSPNQFLVCPEGLCRAEPHLVPPEFSVPPEELRAAWMEMALAQNGVTLLDADEAQRQDTFEALTPLVNFPDTITVRFLPTGENGSTLAIYSRSHYGHSDLGANEKRIRKWLRLLAAKVH